RIALGSGVCGTAAVERRTLVVPDVLEFPGHIACDPASRSEIVVPLIAGDARDGSLLGVLDLDSPRAARFDEADARGLESLAGLFVRSIRETSALANPAWPTRGPGRGGWPRGARPLRSGDCSRSDRKSVV